MTWAEDDGSPAGGFLKAVSVACDDSRAASRHVFLFIKNLL